LGHGQRLEALPIKKSVSRFEINLSEKAVISRSLVFLHFVYEKVDVLR
jgi:hypothetical protein